MENLRTWLNGCRDYTSGVAIYNQYGTDPALKRMFAEPETDFKRKRLEKALEQLWEAREVPAPAIQNITAKRDTSPTPPDEVKLLKETIRDQDEVIDELRQDRENLEEDKEILESEVEELSDELHALKKRTDKNGWPLDPDEVLKSLRAQWYKAFLEQKDLQSRLYEVAKAGVRNKAKEKEAGVMALKILDLQESIFSFYGQRDHYLKHGQLPAPPEPVEECLDPVLYKTKYDNAMKYCRTRRKELQKLSPEDLRYLEVQTILQKWQAEADKYRKLLKLD